MAGTPEAVAAAIRQAVAALRLDGWGGRSPNLSRALPDGGRQAVNFQRVNSGVTGREPGFTVNLMYVPAVLLQAWSVVDRDFEREAGHLVKVPASTRLHDPVVDVLGDRWWHPGDESEARSAAAEAVVLMRTAGQAWFDSVRSVQGIMDHARSFGPGPWPLDTLIAIAAVERETCGTVSPKIRAALQRWHDDPVVVQLLR